MIRVKKENHRSWFMSNYYPCEFVMNGIRYKNAEAAFQSHKVPLEERDSLRTCHRLLPSALAAMWLSPQTGTKLGTM